MLKKPFISGRRENKNCKKNNDSKAGEGPKKIKDTCARKQGSKDKRAAKSLSRKRGKGILRKWIFPGKRAQKLASDDGPAKRSAKRKKGRSSGGDLQRGLRDPTVS